MSVDKAQGAIRIGLPFENLAKQSQGCLVAFPEVQHLPGVLPEQPGPGPIQIEIRLIEEMHPFLIQPFHLARFQVVPRQQPKVLGILAFRRMPPVPPRNLLQDGQGRDGDHLEPFALRKSFRIAALRAWQRLAWPSAWSRHREPLGLRAAARW